MQTTNEVAIHACTSTCDSNRGRHTPSALDTAVGIEMPNSRSTPLSPSTRPALGNMVTSATLGSSDRGMTMTCTLSSSLVGHRHIHSFWFS